MQKKDFSKMLQKLNDAFINSEKGSWLPNEIFNKAGIAQFENWKFTNEQLDYTWKFFRFGK